MRGNETNFVAAQATWSPLPRYHNNSEESLSDSSFSDSSFAGIPFRHHIDRIANTKGGRAYLLGKVIVNKSREHRYGSSHGKRWAQIPFAEEVHVLKSGSSLCELSDFTLCRWKGPCFQHKSK